MARKKRGVKPPTERELYCVILSYLARKPLAVCLGALAPQSLYENGKEGTEAILAAEYGAELAEGCKRMTAVIVDVLHQE